MRFVNLFARKKTASGKVKSTGRRRPTARPIHRRAVFWLVLGGLALSSVGVGAWQVSRSDWIDRSLAQARWTFIAGSARLGFSVKEIFVEGRNETSRKQLLDALRLQRGAPIFAFNPRAARARVKALPWVRRVAIERHLPDTVHLRVEERVPLALWQRGGEFALIDDQGSVIPNQRLDRFGKLVVVVGRDAPSHAAALLDTLAAEPGLALRVTAAVRVAGRRWDIHVDDRITIRLPENGAPQAWHHLAQLARLNGLLEQDLVAVDLRVPDRVVVRRARPAGRKPKTHEQDT